MESHSHSLLSRIETCDTSHLSTLHQDIYNLSGEELGGLVLDLIPALFRRLQLDSHLTSLHALEYVVTSCSPKEVLLSLMEVSCSTADTYKPTLYLLHLRMLALVLNSLPPSSLSHALPAHTHSLLQITEQLSETGDSDTEVWEGGGGEGGGGVEWLLSLHSVFDIDFKSNQLKLISAKRSNRFELSTLLISNSLLISSLRSLQETSLPYLQTEFSSTLAFQLWLLGLSLRLQLTHRDPCTRFLFSQIIRCRLKAILALTHFTDLSSLLSSVDTFPEQEGEQEGFKKMVGLGLSLYIHLSISHPQRLLLDPVPLCLSRGYLYECMCPVSSVLLSHSAPHITSLGLSLLEGEGSASWLLGGQSEWETHGEICHFLTEVMLYSEEEKCRQRAVLLFKKLLPFYPPPLLHWLYRYLLWKVHAPPAVGFLISSLKEEVHATLSGCRGEGHKEYFTGTALLLLLRRVVRVGVTEPGQLLEQADPILSSLNLLRYLMLRDPREKNHTQIWRLFSRIDAYSSHLSLLLTEAIHQTGRDLELSQSEESRTKRNSVPSHPTTLMLQQDLNRLALLQDLNARLREILSQSATV